MPHSSNEVTATPAAPADRAATHFAALLEHETDCWDVHAALGSGRPGFTLLDVRSATAFSAGHIAGAISLPHGRIDRTTVAALPAGHLRVVYCAGPHCNGADKAALRLARLGEPVKKMLGGVTGWRDEGFDLVR